MSQQEKPVLMYYQKQANYRARKERATREKAFKKLKDRLRYLETTKIENTEKKKTELRAEIKKGLYKIEEG